jgi:hypothetical protein
MAKLAEGAALFRPTVLADPTPMAQCKKKFFAPLFFKKAAACLLR